MKIITLLFILITNTNCTIGQDFLWTKEVINDILTLSLPKGFKSSYIDDVKVYSGHANGSLYASKESNYYEFYLYETATKEVETKRRFDTVLNFFINAQIDRYRGKYTLKFTDTIIGRSNGILVYLTPKDTSKLYKHLYYYATLANSKFYLFEVSSPFVIPNNKEINYFFNSILFKDDKIQENLLK